MKFFFPQWQGSGTGKEIMSGAETLKEFVNESNIVSVPLSKKTLQKKNNINGYEALVEQLSTFKQILLEHKPKTIETIGGDCGLEIIPVSYLASRYKNLGVIWFDAHSDINLPEESPSCNFHGMPLRILLDEGDSILKKLMFASIKPLQIHYIGLRDIDSVEQDKIVEDHIYAPLTLNTSHLVSTLKKKKITHLYLHFDLDCLDPEVFKDTYYNVSNGLTIKEAEDCIMELKAKFKVVGSSILESTAADKKDLQPIEHIINLLMYD
jgi:arginase